MQMTAFRRRKTRQQYAAQAPGGIAETWLTLEHEGFDAVATRQAADAHPRSQAWQAVADNRSGLAPRRVDRT